MPRDVAGSILTYTRMSLDAMVQSVYFGTDNLNSDNLKFPIRIKITD